jgi:hypothetical protein
MSEPIKLTLYDENDEEIKTYSRSRISWEFFKKSLHAKVPEDGILNDENMHSIQEFVCNFYDNQFTEDDLIKGADVRETLTIATQIGYVMIKMMKEQGISLPNVPTTME